MSWKKDEDGDELSALMSLDQSAVLQEARMFNETPIRPRQCRILLAKLMYLLQRGDTLSTTEATELFFSITKLFQNKDMSLRQMVYLAIKELSEISENVIMVTSSLMKDMQPKSEDLYRAKAIRALCKITDVSMLPGIERFLKAAIVDKNQSISSSALVSAYHLHGKARDIVRRWGGEVQEVLNGKTASSGISFFGSSKSNTTTAQSIEQYHALGMLYTLRQNDRMAVAKIVQSFGGGSRGGWNIKNPLAHVLLIRYAVKVMGSDPSSAETLGSMLEEWVRYRSEMVSLEAAKAICELQDASPKLVSSAVSTLQSFLGSSRAITRFSAIRALDSLAMTRPEAVQPCNMDMESLVSDNCRSVATLAITTLLKTGNEASVDRLMKAMQGFMSEISDEFRIIVAEAVKNLCVKFPQKHSVFLTFLSGALRDEGGFEFKQAIVEAIIGLAKTVDECRETALAHLCEFIEDCEFTRLSVRILYFLGVEGPATSMPTIYIRHIYNRVVLENAQVRAAAVLALAKFGSAPQSDGKLRESINVLLKRCLDDRDDEVRDRAVWALHFIQTDTKRIRYMRDDSTYPMRTLESKLVDYISNHKNAEKGPISLSTIPKISREQDLAQSSAKKDILSVTSSNIVSPNINKSTLTPSEKADQPSFTNTTQTAVANLSLVPDFSSYGNVLSSSSKPVELTEPETEYTVLCHKHVFNSHIVFQFECTNTLAENVLEDVYVDMTSSDDLDDSISPLAVVTIPELKFNTPSSAYVSFERLNADEIVTGSFECTLKFKVFECDSATGEKLDSDDPGFEDEYLLESVELSEADYILASYIPNWKSEWDRIGKIDDGEEHEIISSFHLPHFSNLKDCVNNLVVVLGMFASDADLNPTNSVAHQALFMGLFESRDKVIVRARMTFQKSNGVTLELCVRSDNPNVCNLVMSSIS
ncbi:hypothetical protein BB559_000897 [Furculomyces boomerangus]|uniref:Coatomer subunit gamma n=1 Tax=Furculomyces boomerangus TaxID=61424 RepID=A0A2T9Z3R1_9FUNG|nr:hypothetical protein BB559_000897 [Furculomyces boomerangus]